MANSLTNQILKKDALIIKGFLRQVKFYGSKYIVRNQMINEEREKKNQRYWFGQMEITQKENEYESIANIIWIRKIQFTYNIANPEQHGGQGYRPLMQSKIYV